MGLAVVVPVLVAGLFGWFNGWLITRFKIQPIVATLVLFIAGRGLAQVMTNGNLQAFREPSFQVIGLGHVFGIPAQSILMAILVVIAAWMLRRTIFGRQLLALDQSIGLLAIGNSRSFSNASCNVPVKVNFCPFSCATMSAPKCAARLHQS